MKSNIKWHKKKNETDEQIERISRVKTEEDRENQSAREREREKKRENERRVKER